MKRIVYVFLTLIISTATFSNVFAQEPEWIIHKFFKLYKQNAADRALTFIYETNPTFKKNGQADINQMKGKLKQTLNSLGRYCGYELISERQLGSNYKLQTFLVKHDKKPIRMSFVIYRPKNRWQLQSFQYEDAVDAELLEADRVYRLGIDQLISQTSAP